MTTDYTPACTTEGLPYEGNQQFRGNGIVKWCAICGTHRPQLAGTIQYVLGGRNWVCNRHPKAKHA